MGLHAEESLAQSDQKPNSINNLPKLVLSGAGGQARWPPEVPGDMKYSTE